MTRGVVLHGTGGAWHVHCEDGTAVVAALRGSVKHASESKLAVGDEVLLRRDARDSGWTISEALPRRSQLARRSPGRGRTERIIAANVDQVVVVFALRQPEPHVAMLDRFLVIAEANGLGARIVVNKVDLADEEEARALFGVYETIGYPLHITSCRTGQGLETLREALQGRTSALSGPSGAGKSSLLNALYPGLGLRVGEISASVNKGRHTTVGAFLHPLPGGGFVVDTPGLREIGLWGVPSDGLDACFPDMRSLRDECRFADCRHLAEPECAVRAALEAGGVSRSRYASYQKLLEEAGGMESY
ncbi:MAG TPA: ribosome small subunit-dependent GTPase A [Gemmatimonadaceae bacterium]